MFGSVGGPEIILIFVVALLVFGPRRLPEIGRKFGKVIGEIRKATGEIRSNVEREIGFDPLDGLQQAGKARREIISTISGPIREVTRGTVEAVRGARKGATDVLRERHTWSGSDDYGNGPPGAEGTEPGDGTATTGPGVTEPKGGAAAMGPVGTEPGDGAAATGAGGPPPEPGSPKE